MKLLVLICICLAVVKARKVEQQHGQGYDHGHQDGQGYDSAPQHGHIIDNHASEETAIDCAPLISYTTSYLTVTSTKLWLNTKTLSSPIFEKTWYTVFVTKTDFETTTATSYESPFTVTAVPWVNSVWKTLTETRTDVTYVTYTNTYPTTVTTTLTASALEAGFECIIRTVDGTNEYLTETTYWIHTQTLHDKVMVGTDIEVTVTSTYYESNVNEELHTQYITRTERATHTVFDTKTKHSESTLWVTHAVKTPCVEPLW